MLFHFHGSNIQSYCLTSCDGSRHKMPPPLTFGLLSNFTYITVSRLLYTLTEILATSLFDSVTVSKTLGSETEKSHAGLPSTVMGTVLVLMQLALHSGSWYEASHMTLYTPLVK